MHLAQPRAKGVIKSNGWKWPVALLYLPTWASVRFDYRMWQCVWEFIILDATEDQKGKVCKEWEVRWSSHKFYSPPKHVNWAEEKTLLDVSSWRSITFFPIINAFEWCD